MEESREELLPGVRARRDGGAVGALLDGGLIVAVAALFLTDEIVVSFHLVFLITTMQAFRLPVVRLLVRAIPAGTVVVVGVLIAWTDDDVPIDEVLELPVLAAVVTIVYTTSIRRQRLTTEVESQRATIEELHRGSLHELQDQLLLTQRLQLNGRLSATMAHDVNNVLAAVQLAAETLSDEAVDAAGVRRIGNELEQYARQAGEITRELLDAARSAESATPQPTQDLTGAIGAVVPQLRRLCGEHIELSVEHTGPTARLEMPRLRLEQILVNLVLNAIEASPPRGGLIELTSRIDASGLGPAKAVIVVADNGHGMSASVRDQIFEPFFTSRSGEGGTGLGLFAVRESLKDANGSISVVSAPGEGATLELRIPVLDSSPHQSGDVVTVASSVPRVTLRVLVVDDAAAIRRSLAAGLRAVGHQVTTAVDGDAAHELIESGSNRFDVLVVDVMMPGLSGIDLARVLAQDHPDLPIVFISGFDRLRPEDWTAGQPVRFLRKPFPIGDLLSELQVLSGSL